jgi:hypothetical protein
MSNKAKQAIAQGAKASQTENKNVPAQTSSIPEDLLKALQGLNLQEKISERKGIKSIFKPEFQSKSERTRCREKMQRSIDLINLFASRGETDKVKKEYETLKSIAEKYYSAGSSFKNLEDYSSGNMGEYKRSMWEMGLKVINAMGLNT